MVSVEEEMVSVALSGVVDVPAILEEKEEIVGMEEGGDITVENKERPDVEYEDGDSKTIGLVVEATEAGVEGSEDGRCEDFLDVLNRVRADEYVTELELTPTLQFTS